MNAEVLPAIDVLVDGDIVVVDYHQQVALADPCVVQTLEREAS